MLQWLKGGVYQSFVEINDKCLLAFVFKSLSAEENRLGAIFIWPWRILQIVLLAISWSLGHHLAEALF